MKRRPSVSVPEGYAAAWAKLFARSPEEQEAERQARQPAPAPHRREAHGGTETGIESTQNRKR